MRAPIASLWVLAACASTSTPAPVANCATVRWGPAAAPTWVKMGNAETLTVFVNGAQVPVAGTMTTHEGAPAFRPAFPLAAGLQYRARSGRGCEATFEVAAPDHRPSNARAVAIYPRADALPENILRFYVYFSEPMAEGNFLDHVRLTHLESGEDLSGVFFDNIYELWSRNRQRITLLVDPGRVKTGLQANQQRGRAFRAGQTYELRIRSSWPTIDGRTLAKGLTKVFRAIPEDREGIDPSRWQLDLPSAGTRAPLRVDFAEPVDHVSVAQFVQVRTPGGQRLQGRWALDDDERTGQWIPRQPWTAPIESHRLVVGGRFEDVAGNNVNGAFDHKIGTLPAGGEDRTITVQFGRRP